ncbi:MAG: arsenate reductase ArsC [Phycisphaerae bacterium]|nr:arsenate reductase ArsC [Phycisphaerae bacterium]
MPKRVLILCTGNSCRSQMAEALWRNLAAGAWDACSAGTRPAGYVHPLAIDVMRELGIDIAPQRSKHIDELADREFDLVVTVCENARETCPTLPGAKRTLHWPFDDPVAAIGTDEQRRSEFRRVRDRIRDRIAAFLAQRG